MAPGRRAHDANDPTPAAPTRPGPSLLPPHLAAAVRRGRMAPQAALERAAWEAEVAALMRRHGLDRALASQVLHGEANLGHLLERRACAAYLAERARQSVFEVAAGDAVPRAFHLGNAGYAEAVVLENRAYDVVLQTPDGPPSALHKLRIRAVTDVPCGRRLRRERIRGSVTDAAPARPQDRYALSDRRLFLACTRGAAVTLTWLDGERMRGMVRSFTRFELVLETRTLGDVTILRHALADFRADA
ncbi:MAG: hypothetical protein RLZZ383_2460 [Pseudomonadota bacterium]